MEGIINKVESREPLEFTFTKAETSEKFRGKYNGFLPIQPGDKISCNEIIEKGKTVELKEKPLVCIPLEKENLLDYFSKAIRTKKKSFSKAKAEILYREMEDRLGSHEEIILGLSNRYKEFYTVITESQRNTLYGWWKKNIIYRRLYLFGLYNKEIDYSGFQPDVLYNILVENPMRIPTIPMEKVFEISQTLGRKPSDESFICGQIVRKIRDFQQKGYFYTPVKKIVEFFPEFKFHKENLTKFYGVVVEKDRVYSEFFYRVENEVYTRIKNLIDMDKLNREKSSQIPTLGGGKPYKIFEDSIVFTEEQEKALEGGIKNYVSIITGGAGCGKTTIIRQIVKNLADRGRNFILASFTGKAVMRLKEVVDEEHHYRCFTLSRMIYKVKNFQEVPVFDTIIIDEASMVSTLLIHEFFTLFEGNFNIILVGDINQLEPIESGSFFKELIYSGKVDVFRLTLNKRTDSDSLIIQNSNELISSSRDFNKPYNFEFGKGFYLVEGGLEMVEKIVQKLKKTGSSDGDITCLTPVNRHIPDIVKIHQKTFLSHSEKAKYKDRIFYIGDRMMQNKNFYSDDVEVMNGEEGNLTLLDPDFLEITYPGDKKITYRWNDKEDDKNENLLKDIEQLNVLNLNCSFSKTIHKSQGSEYNLVLLYLPEDCSRFVSVNMLYTAITRARKKIWIVGLKSTLSRITTQRDFERFEFLGERLRLDRD